jgi:hypothetical protein
VILLRPVAASLLKRVPTRGASVEKSPSPDLAALNLPQNLWFCPSRLELKADFLSTNERPRWDVLTGDVALILAATCKMSFGAPRPNFGLKRRGYERPIDEQNSCSC